MATNIEQRQGRYFATLRVPADVRKKIGKSVYRKALGTDSLSVAKRRAPAFLAEWKSEIEEARGNVNSDDAAFFAKVREEYAGKQPDLDDPAVWRMQLRHAETPKQRAKVLERIAEHADEIASINMDWSKHQRPSQVPEAREFYRAATATGTDAYVDDWVATLQVAAKTKHMRRTTVKRMAERFPTLQDVTRKEVLKWISELLKIREPATVQRWMTDCRLYWRYLAETTETVPEHFAPFDNPRIKVPNNRRQEWEPEELVALHRAATERDEVLADLLKLLMYTGARLGEICGLTVADVTDDAFHIKQAKTTAGIRTVPIHDELKQLVARVIEGKDSGDYLLEITGKHRAQTMSKAFNDRLKSAAGFDGEAHKRKVLHSIRNTVITMLERANVPESTVQDIVGHARSTLTGSTYSGKSTLGMRREALAHLRY